MDKYKVGDKVRVRSDLILENRYGRVFFNERMAEFIGEELTIERYAEFNGIKKYYVEENDWIWTDEMFEGLAEEEHHMSAEEVLEWLCKNYYNSDVLVSTFGKYLSAEDFIKYGTDNMISKIEAYERKKQEEEKEIETEFRYVFRIIKDTKDKKMCVEEKLANCSMLINETIDDMASEYLKDYCKNHKGNFFCTVERNYYVKKGE